MRLTNNTVLITGGASGIGLALAKAFLQRGNTVIIAGRDQAKLAAAKNEFSALVTFHGDIRRESDRVNLADFVTNEFPGFNVLVNNAGVYHEYSFLDSADHAVRIDEELQTNLSAPIQLVERLLPLLRKQPQAAIVNVTSALAGVMHDPAAVYCAAKAGLAMFTRVLRRQLRGTNIRVFEIVPPLVDTRMCRGGAGKMSPARLAEESLQAMARGQEEILVGRTKLFYFLNWLYPKLATKTIGRI